MVKFVVRKKQIGPIHTIYYSETRGPKNLTWHVGDASYLAIAASINHSCCILGEWNVSERCALWEYRK